MLFLRGVWLFLRVPGLVALWLPVYSLAHFCLLEQSQQRMQAHSAEPQPVVLGLSVQRELYYGKMAVVIEVFVFLILAGAVGGKRTRTGDCHHF